MLSALKKVFCTPLLAKKLPAKVVRLYGRAKFKLDQVFICGVDLVVYTKTYVVIREVKQNYVAVEHIQISLHAKTASKKILRLPIEYIDAFILTGQWKVVR